MYAALLAIAMLEPQVAPVPPPPAPERVSGASFRIYPLPHQIPRNGTFAVKLGGRDVPVMSTNVQTDHENWSWDIQGSPSSLVRFEFEGKIELEVTSEIPLPKVRVLPSALGIQPKVSGNSITLTLAKPANFILHVDDDPANCLHVFAAPLEKPGERPKEAVFFGPGLHRPGVVQLRESAKTVFLDPGAVVRGFIHARDLKGVRILGRGILDGSQTVRGKDSNNMIRLDICTDSLISGPTLLDNPTWNVLIAGGKGTRIQDVKIIAARATSDGFDLVNTSDVSIERCFVRNFDDAVALKGIEDFKLGGKPLRNVRVRDSVFHCDNAWGGPFAIGYETFADEISEFTVEDSQVIFCRMLLRILIADPGGARNVTLRNLDVEMPKAREPFRFVVGRDNYTQWYKNDREADGFIEGVLIENVRIRSNEWAESDFSGRNAKSSVRGVQFRNVLLNGKPLSEESARFRRNEHAEPIRFQSGGTR